MVLVLFAHVILMFKEYEEILAGVRNGTLAPQPTPPPPCDALAAKLQSGAVDFGKIGAAGREWALEHYTPKAYGARFLADVARARRRKKER